MFEHRRQPLLPRPLFYRRLLKYGAASLGVALASLLLGILGYRYFESMAWIDAFVNAAMLLGGMGPVGELHSQAGKVFAGLYALYCGLVVIVSMGILLAPIFHRFLHRFHLEAAAEDSERGSPRKSGGHSQQK